eukprot:Opistho-1_new@105550
MSRFLLVCAGAVGTFALAALLRGRRERADARQTSSASATPLAPSEVSDAIAAAAAASTVDGTVSTQLSQQRARASVPHRPSVSVPPTTDDRHQQQQRQAQRALRGSEAPAAGTTALARGRASISAAAPSSAQWPAGGTQGQGQQQFEMQNLLNLLYTVAEDQAKREGFVHRGITCNSCSASPIRGIRYKCANCVDYDLCENCEALDRHNRTHVFLRIKIPIPPLANPRAALLSVFYPGGKHPIDPSLSLDRVRKLQRETHFDHVEIEALYEQFKTLSTLESSEGGIDRETFDQCLGPLGADRNLVTERIFLFFDQDGDGVIGFDEFVFGLSILCKGSQEEKIECKCGKGA